jgi:hypothetical protein
MFEFESGTVWLFYFYLLFVWRIVLAYLVVCCAAIRIMVGV